MQCPFSCRQKVAVQGLKLFRRGSGRAGWHCSSCWQIKKKQIRVEWTKFVCVQCTTSSHKECLLEACPIGCATKQAVEKIKDALLQPKVKAKPIFSCAIETSEEQMHQQLRDAKKNEVANGNLAKNPFPPGHHGLCPHCFKAADVSGFRMDSRTRIWCNQQECKKRSLVTDWFCVRCSQTANSQRRSVKEVRITFNKCVCYAKILSQQGKVIVSCPHVTCSGWKAYEKLPASRDARITCGSCGNKRPVVQWHCFACNMTKDNCICNLPDQSKATSVFKRPAKRGLPKPKTKRGKR